MNFFIRLKAKLRFNEAVRKANKSFKETGNRHYVIPMSDGKLLVLDRPNFRKLKRKRYITHKAFIRDLERECFYCTPYKNGTGELSAEAVELKKKQYFSWLEEIAKSKKKISAKRTKL